MTAATNHPDTERLLTVDQATTLADDLLRLLTPHVGDEDAVNARLARWADTLGPTRLGQVAMAAVQTTFVACLRRLDAGETPPRDATAFTEPEGTTPP